MFEHKSVIHTALKLLKFLLQHKIYNIPANTIIHLPALSLLVWVH